MKKSLVIAFTIAVLASSFLVLKPGKAGPEVVPHIRDTSDELSFTLPEQLEADTISGTVAAAASASGLYGTNGVSLYSINKQTGSAIKVGNYGAALTGTHPVNRIVGIAYSNDGTFYGISYGQDDLVQYGLPGREEAKLFTINPKDGLASLVGPLGIDVSENTNLTFDPTSNKLLGIDPVLDRLFTINPVTGAATPTGSTSAFVLGVDYYGQTLYAITDHQFGTFDFSTGTFTPIGDIGFQSSLGALGVDPADGTLYANFLGSDLYTLDKNTGNRSLVGSTGTSGFSGFTFAPVPQITLIGLEVTQGIQNWNNVVPLVKGRRTFARAHVTSTTTLSGVKAILVARREGVELIASPISPSNRGETIVVLKNPERDHLDDSFYFELPTFWTYYGPVELEFQGDGIEVVCPEHAGTDDDYCKKVEVSFTKVPTLTIKLINYIWEDTKGREHKIDYFDVGDVYDQIYSTFPVSKLDIVGFQAEQWIRDIEEHPYYGGFPALSRILDNLEEKYKTAGADEAYYLGVLAEPPGDLTDTRSVLGLAPSTPADVAVGYVDTSLTLAHEMGHAAGREHTYCRGDEKGPDPNFPDHPRGKISTEKTGSNAFYGFQASHFTDTIKIPNPNVGDLMSYCAPSWPSSWTYTHTMTALKERFGTSSSSLTAQDRQPIVMVSGVITLSGPTGTLEPVYRYESEVPISTPEPGDYTLRFEDSTGQPLVSYSFDPAVGVADCVGCTQTPEIETGSFVFRLPWPANTARIVLLHNSQQLDVRTASANEPSVTVTYPNGGENLNGLSATLSWSASDADGDPLEYIVQYSPDAGATWQTLATSWPSTTFEFNLDWAAGSDQALVRVLVSDGFHTVQDQSDATFTVVKHAPFARIGEPKNNNLYVGGQLLHFEGMAFDNEDGTLGSSAFSWASNRDGHLGDGQSLVMAASAMSTGTHTITLTAQDSDDQTGTDSVEVEIYRERPTLSPRLSVAPYALSFVAAPDGAETAAQTISTRNPGDGGLTWSVTADQNWIKLDTTTGAALDDLAVSADPTGLEEGSYSGTITFSAPEADNSPQTVEVYLYIHSLSGVYLPIILK